MKRAIISLLPFLFPVATSIAATWPAQPIEWIVPYTENGTSDVLARAIAPELAKRLDQPVTVQNKPGQGGTTGTEYVANAKPDGYTILLGAIGPIAINPKADLAPVSLLMEVPNLLLVTPSLPVNSVSQLVDYAKKQGGAPLPYASPGVGTSPHLAGEIFAAEAGIPLTHQSYDGSQPALAAIERGDVSIMFDNLPSALPLVQSGKLKALAITGDKRSPQLPEVPSILETGLPGYHVTSWFGVLVPKGTPQPVIDRLNKELTGILADSVMQEKIKAMGGTVAVAGPEVFAQRIEAETRKAAVIVKAASRP